MTITRIALVSITLCTACGAAFYFRPQTDIAPAPNLDAQQRAYDAAPKGSIFRARRDISKGMMVNMAFLSINRQIPMSKIPTDAVTSYTQIENRVAKYDISAGQILSLRDLLPINPPMEELPQNNDIIRYCK